MTSLPNSNADVSNVDVDLASLISEFFSPGEVTAQLGSYEPLEQPPEPYNSLLNHHAHMTVTVESHHQQPVRVVVHRHKTNINGGRWYVREITLRTLETDQVVQYGIVRLDINALQAEVWDEIESQSTPLGRVLIKHNVLRDVQLCRLWKFHAGDRLAGLLEMETGTPVYGRTALIYCDGHPAIELLEVVAP
ncbi:MAG: hypothetical protein AAGJ83_09255 [Planctomycetota bacterium]